MGCCGTKSGYPEIDEAETIEEIFNDMDTKSKECKDEANQIKNYLQDRSRIPTKFDVAVIILFNLIFLIYRINLMII